MTADEMDLAAFEPTLDLTPRVSVPPRRDRAARSTLGEVALLPETSVGLTPGLTVPPGVLGLWLAAVLGMGLLALWGIFHPFHAGPAWTATPSVSSPSAVNQLMHAGTTPEPATLMHLEHPTPEVLDPHIVYTEPTLRRPVAMAPPAAESAATPAVDTQLCVRTTQVLLDHARGQPVLVNGEQVGDAAQIEAACNRQHQEPPLVVFTVGS